jgi:hypothetical protein
MFIQLKILNQKAFYVLFIGIWFFTSCSFYSKDDYLKDFNKFINDVETNFESFSEEDWKLKDADFQNYTTELYEKFKEELTDDDQKLIGKLKTKYLLVKSKSEMKNLGKQINDGLNQLKGAVDEIFK